MATDSKQSALGKEKSRLAALREKLNIYNERVKRSEQTIERLEFEIKIDDYNTFAAALTAAGLSLTDVMDAVARGDYAGLEQKATAAIEGAADGGGGSADDDLEDERDDSDGADGASTKVEASAAKGKVA